MTAGFTPPGTFFISFMTSVMSRSAFCARMRATKPSSSRVTSGGAPTSSAAAIRVGISPPGTLRIWSSESFSPACFANARVWSSRILSAVGLKFGWSQKTSFWSRAAKVLSGVKMLAVVANAAAPAPAFEHRSGG